MGSHVSRSDGADISHLLQRLARDDWGYSSSRQSGLIFHWHVPDEVPAPTSPSSLHTNLRRYIKKVVRFASAMVERTALAHLDVEELAEVAASHAWTGYHESRA